MATALLAFTYHCRHTISPQVRVLGVHANRLSTTIVICLPSQTPSRQFKRCCGLVNLGIHLTFGRSSP